MSIGSTRLYANNPLYGAMADRNFCLKLQLPRSQSSIGELSAWWCDSCSCRWKCSTCALAAGRLQLMSMRCYVEASATCRKIDVAHAVMIGTAGSTQCQPEHGDGCTSHPAGSSTAGIGHCPTALAVHGSCDHSQAGISAALPGAKSAADLLPHAVQMHGLLGAAEQEGPSRVL